MSAHGHSTTKEHPLVVVPEGAPFQAPLKDSPVFKGSSPFASLRHKPTLEHYQPVTPDHIFDHNTPGVMAENFKPELVAVGDTAAMYTLPEQNVYTVFESSVGCPAPDVAVRLARDTVADFWQEVQTAGDDIGKDNAGQYMQESLDRVRLALRNAGIDPGVSVGLSIVKLFRHGDGWGAAVAYAGNSTHAFITNRDKRPLHQNEDHTRTGQVISLTKAEFDPAKYHAKKPHLQSSLNADPNDTAQPQRVFVIPRMRHDSWITLCNDQVTGMASDPEQAQKPKVRDEALLDERNPQRAATALLNDHHKPGASVLIVRLKEETPTVPAAAPESATETARLSASFRKMVALAVRGAGVIREFWRSDDEKVRRQRHIVEAAASLALAGALYYSGRKLFPEQVKGFEKKVFDKKHAQRVGALAVKASDGLKQGKEKLVTVKPAEVVRERAAALKEQAQAVRTQGRAKGRTVADKLKARATQLPSKVARLRK